MNNQKSLNALWADTVKRTKKKNIIFGFLLILFGAVISVIFIYTHYLSCLDSWINSYKHLAFDSFWDYFWASEGTMIVYLIIGLIPVFAGIWMMIKSDLKHIYEPTDSSL